MKLRLFQLSDTDSVVKVYRDAIRRIGPTKYTAEEVAAWARHPADVQDFGRRLTRGYTVVAEEDSHIYAFGQIEPYNCFAFLYTTGGAKTKCLGAVIYDTLEAHAYANGVIDLYAEASRISLPFCLRRGFTVSEVVRQDHFGVELEWYRMKKTRESALSARFAKSRSLAMQVEGAMEACSRRAS